MGYVIRIDARAMISFSTRSNISALILRVMLSGMRSRLGSRRELHCCISIKVHLKDATVNANKRWLSTILGGTGVVCFHLCSLAPVGRRLSQILSSCGIPEYSLWLPSPFGLAISACPSF